MCFFCDLIIPITKALMLGRTVLVFGGIGESVEHHVRVTGQ